MTPELLNALSEELFAAWQQQRTIAPLRNRAELTLDHAYRIQQGFVERRLAAGETIVGKKIGVTSKAVQDLLEVRQPDFGQLTSGMVVPDGGTLDVSKMIQPKAEAELAFVLGEDLVGPGITAVDVINATAWVAPCIELVDSRIQGWDIKIVDTVADNASCGMYVIGEAKASPLDVDLNLAGTVVKVDGEVVTTGAGAAVQSGPANAVAWLANTLGELGLPFRKGEVILSGSQSILLPVTAGQTLECIIGGLGACSVTFTNGSAQ
ncbi:MAG: fumarylacetoacetate hydrolase family protein [Myxococcales bacterium]|nr:fumarylacetoacetate hydrolase family protein [Myxococcales bacterium]MCB9647301.1 fumarylacetoacetate hydrolase family protein [Deltaproteobacteria bacterium]